MFAFREKQTKSETSLLWRAVGEGGRTLQQFHSEVTILVLGDWQRLAQDIPPETPVIFRYDGQRPMYDNDYCDGLQVGPSQMWVGHDGWQPCILVTLGEAF